MRGKSRLDDGFEEGPNDLVQRMHGRLLIDRLAMLLNAGYRLDAPFISKGGDLPLIHPNKKTPLLELWDDGLVNDRYPGDFRDRPDHERTLFEPEDTQGFEAFVAGIPKPTWRQKVGVTSVAEAIQAATALVVIGLLWWALVKAGGLFWGWLRGLW